MECLFRLSLMHFFSFPSFVNDAIPHHAQWSHRQDHTQQRPWCGLTHCKKKRESPAESHIYFRHCVNTLSLIQPSKQSFVVGVMIYILQLIWEAFESSPGPICPRIWALTLLPPRHRKLASSLTTPISAKQPAHCWPLCCCLCADSFIHSQCVTFEKELTPLSPILLFHWQLSYQQLTSGLVLKVQWKRVYCGKGILDGSHCKCNDPQVCLLSCVPSSLLDISTWESYRPHPVLASESMIFLPQLAPLHLPCLREWHQPPI